MDEDEFLANATARILMIETPADQIALPPAVPTAEAEAAAMWRPSDRYEESRVDVGQREDPSAAAAYGVWLGLSTLSMVIADSRPEQKQRVELNPLKADEDDDEPKRR